MASTLLKTRAIGRIGHRCLILRKIRMANDLIFSIIRRIASEIMAVDLIEVTHETRFTDWHDLVLVNDLVCLQLNLNISNQDAAGCKTIGDYTELVKNRLNN